MIGFAPRRSLTAHHDWKEVLETLRAKFHTYVDPKPCSISTNPTPSVKLPKSFVAINLSEKVPDAFDEGANGKGEEEAEGELILPPHALEG